MTSRCPLARAGLALLLAASAGFFAAGRAEAQVFSEVIRNSLDGNCQGLSGITGSYGANLGAICSAGGSGNTSASGGSIAIQGTQGVGSESRRLLLRLEEQRQDARLGSDVRAASADQTLKQGRLGLFFTSEFEWVNKSQSPFEPAFDSNSKGFIAGADYALFPWLTMGGAVHYSYLDGEFTGDNGSFNTQAMGFTLYGSFSPMPNLFVDATIGYVHREYDISRRATYITVIPSVVDGFADGSTTGNEFNMGVVAGYDFHLGGFTVGPRAGVNYWTNHINSYAEGPRGTQAPTGLELAYDDQHVDSLVTKLGFYASYAFGLGFGVLVPQISGEWVHEFLNNQRVIYFRFREDNAASRLRFQNDKPDRDYFHVGAGLVLVLPKDVSAFVSYRVLLGYNDRIAHTLDAGIRIQF